MRKTYLRCFVLAITLIVGSISPAVPAFADVASPAPPPLMISELQTEGLNGTAADGTMEFVELYNPGEAALDITDWQVQYLSASSNGSTPPTRILASLEGSVAPHGYVLLSYAGYLPDADVHFGAEGTPSSGWLARSGGHVRVVDASGATIDLVTWGTGVVVGNWWKSVEVPAGKSIQRILPGDPAYTTGLVFATPSTATTPEGGDLILPETPPEPICVGVVLSELLPNPAGADSGHEFIELYNPTADAVSLLGCSLRLGTDGSTFMLPDVSLPAGGYRAFSDTETGITLPNATAQTVWLFTSVNEQGVLYPDDLPDDQAWALIDGIWQATNLPTVGAPNVPTPPVVEVSALAVSLDSPAPCPDGKERNPETNRCRTIPEPTIPAACPTGQERNPATDRCRSIAISAPTVQPCKENQERNPETNRCRAVLGASTGPAPCPTGQTRNPQTNRCRKDASSSSLATVQDVKTSSKPSAFKWWVAGVGLTSVVGYGIYEWRQDIRNKLYARRLRKKHIVEAPQHVEDG